MKTIFIAGVLLGGTFLTGCETTVVEHRHGHDGYGYRDNYRGTEYRTRNVERTNVYETNVHRDVHRDVRREEERGVAQSREGRVSVSVSRTEAQPQTHAASNGNQRPLKKAQTRNHKGKDQDKRDEQKQHSDQ